MSNLAGSADPSGTNSGAGGGNGRDFGVRFMYAVIEDSGRQMRVSPGQTVIVDLRPLAEGATSVEFGKVLLVADGSNVRVGAPTVAGVKVKAEVIEQVKGPKLQIWHVRRRKSRSRTKTGHRQKYLQVKIQEIVG